MQSLRKVSDTGGHPPRYGRTIRRVPALRHADLPGVLRHGDGRRRLDDGDEPPLGCGRPETGPGVQEVSSVLVFYAKLFLGPPDTFLSARTAVAQVMHINPVDGNLYLSCRRWPGVILSFRQKVTAMTGSVEWQCRMTVSPRRRASMSRHCALSLFVIVCH